MKLYLIAASLLLASPVAAFSEQTCKVTDPTGTPLNIRQNPNGKVIGKIANGVLVKITQYDTDAKGRPWAYVVSLQGRKKSGWVIREFVSCLD